tara:strand:+ start:88 stop:528 length:441 start_codon:yes stop_codon:yes gene_type:complete
MNRNDKFKLNILFLFLVFTLPFVQAEEILVDVELDSCVNVDLNEDEIADVIICYNEDESITVDNVIAVDEELVSDFDENSVIIPSSITTIKRYELPFDTEEFKNEIISEYISYIYLLSSLVLICFVLICYLYNQVTKKSKRRKKRK